MGETALLPAPLQPAVMSFIDLLNSELLPSQEFWQTATCVDAVNAILEQSNEHFGLDFSIPVDTSVMSGVEQELAFGLFQIATVSFASTAAGQSKAREFMGIRKSFLFR